MTTADIPAVTGADGEEIWQLRLYVAGQTPKSARALVNLTKLCESHLHGRDEIEVVDLALDPNLARSDDILAVPTLVRRLPAPFRTVIGDLSNAESVLIGLRLGLD